MSEEGNTIAASRRSHGRRLQGLNIALLSKLASIIQTPEKFFLLFAGLFGLLFVFLIPPMQSPDEQSHLYRAYQTSSFGVFAEKFEENGITRYGTRLPKSMYEAGEELRMPVAGNPALEFNTSLYREYLSRSLDEDDTILVKSEAVNVYSPIVYIPQAIGFGIGRIIDASPVMMIWLGRITNLIFWLAMVYFAIRMLPLAKWGLVILALNPVTVTISASLSGDVTSIALAFVFVSMILASRKKPHQRLNTKQLILLVALSAALCLTKPVNIFLLPLLLLIPKQSFGGMSKKLVGCLLIGGVGLVLGTLWNISTKEILDIAVQGQRPGYGVSPSQQLHYILLQPISYFMTVIHNFVIVDGHSSANAVLNTYFGVFGWLDTTIPLWTQFLYFGGLILAVLYQIGRGVVFSLREKILMVTVFTMAFGAAITAMYMNYTPVAAKTFEGVQGRYFMPASIVLLGLFTGKKKFVSNYDKSIPWVLALIILIVLLMTTYKLLARYY